MGFDETAKVALFGANSTGKTLQIASLIRAYGPENVGIVSCEKGLSTIRSMVSEDQVFECDDYQQFRQAYKWASERFKGRGQWVCVDGGTRALQWNAGEIWGGTDAAYTHIAMGLGRDTLDPQVRQYLRFITEKGAIDPQAQYIKIGRDADRLLNAWVRLDCNMYWTFWETMSSRGQYEKGLPWQADAPGAASRDAIYGTFDYILRITYDKGHPLATHDPTRAIARTKSRDDWHGGIKVPTSLDPFDLAEFVKILRPVPANVVTMPASGKEPA